MSSLRHAIAALLLVAFCACSASKPTPIDAGGGRESHAGSGGASGSSGQGSGGQGSGGQGSGGVMSGGQAGAGVVGGGGRGAGGTNADAGVDAGNVRDASAGSDAGAPGGTPYVYVSGGGPDITYFTIDLTTGALTKKGTASGGNNPSYLAIAPNKQALYAIDEGSGADSQVIAFAINPANGALTEINRAPTSGQGAPHLAVHPSGKWLAVAHYNSGHTSILPIRADGGVDAAIDVKKGPNDGCMNAHQAVFDSTGKYLFVPCLGSNYVIQYKFDSGMLSYNDPATVAVAGGPRHMAFEPGEAHAFVLSELESLLTSFSYDASKGVLSSPASIDSYEATKGASAHVVVHPNKLWLYASNRTENSIGLFAIDAAGRLSPVAFQHDMIATPRDFTIDPTGQWLISANMNGAQNLIVFRIAPADGKLTRAQVVPVGGSPQFVGVVYLP